MKKGKQKGFSMAELLIVVLVIAIIVVLALPQIMSSRRLFRFAGVQRQVVSAFREGRQQAISQRKPITVRYDNTGKRLLLSGGTFGSPGDGNNQIFELAGDGVTTNELVYGRPDGVSTAALGDGTNLTSLSGSNVDITFQTDGSVVDASNNPQNKALFFYDTKTPADTAFAVSILGAGGRTKLWRYSSNGNVYVE
ncbi:MAG: prepilin-type N-terminal cleavage/methylation domain-containing protein [Pyrinomonadaceae bacterium]|nr:prepilin-type N-terminal cleavage/methylation domain-containing protein [Pyrinomonadaceae bacterium]